MAQGCSVLPSPCKLIRNATQTRSKCTRTNDHLILLHSRPNITGVIFSNTAKEESLTLGHTREAGHYWANALHAKPIQRDMRKNSQEPIVTVLIRGESGTGKELWSQSTAQLNQRHNHSIIALTVLCPFPETSWIRAFGLERRIYRRQLIHERPNLRRWQRHLILDEIGETTT